MASITLDAVLYEGAAWEYDTDDADRPVEPPTDELGSLLYSLGFRQFVIHDARYDKRLILDSPNVNGRTLVNPRGGRGNRVEPGSTVVYDAETMTALAVLAGDRTTKKSAPKKKTASGRGKSKAAKSEAVEDPEFTFAPGEYRWR